MNNGCSVCVVGAAIVFVPVDYGQSATEDLKTSILFAQLVANKRLLNAPLASWFDGYAGVLDDFWVRGVKQRQDILLDKNNPTSPVQWAAKSAANGSNDEIRAVAAFSAWVSSLPTNSPVIRLLRNNMQPTSPGKVVPAKAKVTHLLVVMAQKPGSMTCLSLEFKTRQTLEGNPWTQPFAAELLDGVVSARYFRATLSEILYALYRDSLTTKIKERVSDNVLCLSEIVDLTAEPLEQSCGP